MHPLELNKLENFEILKILTLSDEIYVNKGIIQNVLTIFLDFNKEYSDQRSGGDQGKSCKIFMSLYFFVGLTSGIKRQALVIFEFYGVNMFRF